MVLEKIEHENDIKRINKNELPILAEEIRSFLIDKISKTGGHLASNLGVVELTMALHLAFDLPEDKIIWDVGHQSYTHKLLTGRREGFVELRKFGGMSGFPKTKESDCDCFNTGHSSTSISAGLGLVKARDLKGENNTVVAVIGDGSLTGGMAYEALNNAAKLETNYIIVLNDNNMSISENVGGMSKYLNSVRIRASLEDLLEGIKNISEISDECGMPNSKAYTEAFKEIYGISPSNYRKRFKKNFAPTVEKEMKLHDFDSILEDFINEEETVYEDEKCKITLNAEHIKLETEEEIKISNKGKRIQIVL